LDNAATSQKPRRVIDALRDYYERDNSNVHRGIHSLSQRATFQYERARGKVKNFIGAASEKEIVFVRGATEAINLVAASWGRRNIRSGDEILVTHLEHHSNIVPWQLLCEETGATLRVVPITDAGDLEPGAYDRLLGDKTRLVALNHVSNALGTINPVAEMVAKARGAGIMTLVDGCQATPHMAVNVQEIGCDFYAFSGHKMFGPTGIGALYGRLEVLKGMAPYQGGGDMISSVSFEKTEFNEPPARFEAGTPNIGGAIGLGEAVDYLGRIGLERIAAYERQLLEYGTAALSEIPGLRIIGTARHKAAVLSFVLEDIHPLDVGAILDQQGIAVRVGHHCAQPVMDRFGVPATVRASLAFYNTFEEIDRLAEGIRKTIKMFK